MGPKEKAVCPTFTFGSPSSAYRRQFYNSTFTLQVCMLMQMQPCMVLAKFWHPAVVLKWLSAVLLALADATVATAYSALSSPSERCASIHASVVGLIGCFKLPSSLAWIRKIRREVHLVPRSVICQ